MSFNPTPPYFSGYTQDPFGLKLQQTLAPMRNAANQATANAQTMAAMQTPTPSVYWGQIGGNVLGGVASSLAGALINKALQDKPPSPSVPVNLPSTPEMPRLRDSNSLTQLASLLQGGGY